MTVRRRIMGLFDADENKIRAMYKRAHVESGGEFVNPRDYLLCYFAIMLVYQSNPIPFSTNL